VNVETKESLTRFNSLHFSHAKPLQHINGQPFMDSIKFEMTSKYLGVFVFLPSFQALEPCNMVHGVDWSAITGASRPIMSYTSL
jgi:hypothetical protein